MKIYKRIAIHWEATGNAVLEVMEDSMTALPRSQQNPRLSHLHPPFDGKAPITQLEERGYRYREQGISTVMIQVGVVTEERVVRTVQGSMAVDQEADRLKVSHC